MNTAATPDDPRPAARYVVRTVDEDWIDLFDPPSRIDAKRPAWEEARRRVRNHPECITLVIDRHTGATLWKSDPEVPRRYVVRSVADTVFHALDRDLSVAGELLSAHKLKDDALTAFYEAAAEPSRDIVVLLDTAASPAATVVATSEDHGYDPEAA